MVSALTQWKRFDENRQAFMKLALEKIINTANISKDVYEIASKSLA
jgi:aminopeptidase N